MSDKTEKPTEIDDQNLEQAQGGVQIDNNHMTTGGMVSVQIDNNHMPMPTEDAVNINNEYQTVDPIAVNINNEY